MGFRPALFKRWLPLAAVAWGMVLSAGAQRPPLREGQPILFSSPAGDNGVSNTPSLLPKPPESLDLKDANEAPVEFHFSGSSPALPAPWAGPLLNPAGLARERNQNWALMTPAEILGEITPEKMLGLTERDAFGQPKNLTALERYVERQHQQLLLARTNGLQTGSAAPPGWFSGDQRFASNSIFGGRGSLDNPAGLGFNSVPFDPFGGRAGDNNNWSRLSGATPATPPASTAPASEPNPALLGDMERFRQLLNPGASPATPAVSSSADGLKTSLPKSLLGAGLAQPQTARIGASFTPLSSGIGRPTELPKLTGSLGLNSTSPPPASLWLSPSPFAAPQRKF